MNKERLSIYMYMYQLYFGRKLETSAKFLSEKSWYTESFIVNARANFIEELRARATLRGAGHEATPILHSVAAAESGGTHWYRFKSCTAGMTITADCGQQGRQITTSSTTTSVHCMDMYMYRVSQLANPCM